MKQIPLTQEKFATVDDSDFEQLSKFKWYAIECYKGRFYAARRKSGKRAYMHREILGLAGSKTHCDHVNGDGLDNRRSNLRACSASQNLCNRSMMPNNTSGYKGVSLYKKTGKWGARIKINGKAKHLGVFDDLKEAAKAYDKAAIEIHGKFAKTNF